MTTTDQGAQPSAQEGTSRRKLNDPYFLIRQQCGCLSAALPDRVGDEKEIGAVLVDAMREGRFVTRVVPVDRDDSAHRRRGNRRRWRMSQSALVLVPVIELTELAVDEVQQLFPTPIADRADFDPRRVSDLRLDRLIGRVAPGTAIQVVLLRERERRRQRAARMEEV